MNKIVKTEIVCPQCKGKREVFSTSDVLGTFGIALFLHPYEICKTCKGRGFVWVKTEITEK